MSDSTRKVTPGGIVEYRNANGELHREDGPAVEWPDGSRDYYVNGKLHREEGPAVEGPDGYKAWYVNGELHREDGPAVQWSDGSKSYWVNGKLHREDGPAAQWSDGSKSYWVNGENLTEEEFLTLTKQADPDPNRTLRDWAQLAHECYPPSDYLVSVDVRGRTISICRWADHPRVYCWLEVSDDPDQTTLAFPREPKLRISGITPELFQWLSKRWR